MQPRSGCAINAAVEALGDHWSVPVLRDIIFGDRRYFRELLTGSLEETASNILADRLKRLVAAGILVRDDAARGQRVRYSLTEAASRPCRSSTRSATRASTGARASQSCGLGRS